MSYILERRQNGKEMVMRLEDEAGERLYSSVGSQSFPAFIEIGGEKIKSDSIVCVAFEDSWWPNDSKALRSRGKWRCDKCLVVHTMGDSCSCLETRLEKAGLMQQERKDNPVIPPDRIQVGMIKALKIALTYPSVTLESKFVVGYMRRHGIKANDLV